MPALVTADGPSPFEERRDERRAIKQIVGTEVVRNVLWPEDRDATNPILICDGSSALYVWIAYLEEWTKRASTVDTLKVRTNNLAVAHEWQKICRRAPGWVEVELAPGVFKPKYNGVFGKKTVAWANEFAQESICILPVTSLDGHLGPNTNDPDARAFKSAILRSARTIVVIADFDKLRRSRNAETAVDPERWRELLGKANEFDGKLWVITARSPAVPAHGKPHPIKGGIDGRSGDQIEADNLFHLKQHLGQRLIAIDAS